MPGKLKNRYISGCLGFYHALRESIAKPLAFLLLSFFILTHTIAVYAELQDYQWSNSSTKTEELSPDSQSDLQTESTNWRDLRGNREVADRNVDKRIEVKDLYSQNTTGCFLSSSTLRFFSSTAIPYSISHSEAPFSSRPPPTPSSLQG